MNQHPHLKTLHTLYTEEAQPFRKVHRMIDLFESIIKSHTVVIIAEYVQHNQLSDTAQGLLAQGLRTPSLGTWQLFSRVLFEELQAVNYAWTLNEFASGFEFLDKSLNSDKTNVIAFRNGYAHGATPSDEQCENDIRKFEPYLDKLLSLSWIKHSSIVVNEGIVYVQSEANLLSCHPIFLFRDENKEASFAFFNDLKNDKIGLLNYPLGKHYREKEFFKVFHEYLPLNEWKKSGNNEFYQRIEELTETFKGRTFEREKLLQFVINETKGYCSIQGNPGIGKSALIAQFFKDLRASEKAKNVNVVEYFIRRGTAQAQTEYLLNYLIKRTDELFPQGKEVRAEGKMVFEIQQQLFNKWRLWAEHSNGKKLLFLIDGLDEGVENNIVSYLPRENFQDILIIYGSRPGGHKTLDELWTTLPIENHIKIELSGLSKEDIRALVYEVANKYDLEKDSEWIAAVQKRSQGNPLYLKLLCDSIENGGIALNDLNALPSKIDEYYKAILLRYAQDPDGDALLAGLYTFAAAKDYLTMAHLGLMNQLGDATLERIGSTLKEVIYENPLTEDVLDYQLFHESFREYLVKEKTLKVSEAKQRIIEFCGGWKELDGQWEQRYILEHYASHLHESTKEHHSELLLKLIYDTNFQTTQKKVLRGFEATNTLFRLALLRASDIKRFDEQLEAGLCLVDLKYEEANDAPQIVAMVANGEIDLALKRIESFGGSDKEGMQRKFILYMLCLMELTLLESKDKPFRKDAIQKLLHHLDEQIPADTSLINWNDFFPSNLMFLLVFQWSEIGVDYLIVFKRTDHWEGTWLIEEGPFLSSQLELVWMCIQYNSMVVPKCGLLRIMSEVFAKQGEFDRAVEIADSISDGVEKFKAQKAISTSLTNQDKLDEALAIVNKIDNESDKNSAFAAITWELAKSRKFQDAQACALQINDVYFGSQSIRQIAFELYKNRKSVEALTALRKAVGLARSISDDYLKSYSFQSIYSIFVKFENLNEASSAIDYSIKCARRIGNAPAKSKALQNISVAFAQQMNSEAADSFMEEALACIQGITEENDIKWSALQEIALGLAKQNRMAEALDCAKSIEGRVAKSSVISEISKLLVRQSKIEEAIVFSQNINDELGQSFKSRVLEEISIELVKQGKQQEAINNYKNYYDGRGMAKLRALKRMINHGANIQRLDIAYDIMLKTLAFDKVVNDKKNIDKALKNFANKLSEEGKILEALMCARKVSNNKERSFILADILTLSKLIGDEDKYKAIQEETIECAKNIIDVWLKSSALVNISNELAKQKEYEYSNIIMQELFEYIKNVNDSRKEGAQCEISKMLAVQGKFDEAIECSLGITNSVRQSSAMRDISIELAKQGHFARSLENSEIITREDIRVEAMCAISSELSNHQKFEKSQSILNDASQLAKGISDENFKARALIFIAAELNNQGRIAEKVLLINAALECKLLEGYIYREILVKITKLGHFEEAISYAHLLRDYVALSSISVELAKQGNLDLSESIGLEIIQLAERHNCWKTIAQNGYIEMGWQKSLQQNTQFKSDEARLYYLKGWANAVSECDTDSDCMQEASIHLAHDSESLENLLQKHALHEVFFGKSGPEKINRLNQTVDIQWALDIVAQFPKEESSSRLSTNLETWLHEIADEDDRDQIELWAKQVAKGKITEEEFGERVRGLF